MKAAGCTVIAVTHRNLLLAHVDKLLVMSFGQVIARARATRSLPNPRQQGCARDPRHRSFCVSNITVAVRGIG